MMALDRCQKVLSGQRNFRLCQCEQEFSGRVPLSSSLSSSMGTPSGIRRRGFVFLVACTEGAIPMRLNPSQRLKFSLLCAATLLGGLEGLWGLAAQAQVSSTGSADLAGVRPVMDCADLIWMGQKPSLMAGVPLQVHTAAVAKDAPAPYCDVKGYVSPMVDFEVRLPTTNWTQRFLQVGCGAFCGTLAIQVPNTGSVGNAQIERGELALAATDMGHPTDDGLDGTWWAADPQLRVDFAYRAAHVTAIAAKALMRMYY